MGQIRTLIVDDHPLVRRALFDLLGGAEALEVVGEASNGNEAILIATAVKPDVVLMDLHMPECDGVEATERLQTQVPETKVLMLTISENEEDLFAAIKAGARGYVLKNEEPAMILQAVQYVALGGIMVSPQMAVRLSKELGRDGPEVALSVLNAREENIVKLLAHGANDEEIAKRLNVRETWVGLLLSNIMQRLELGDRASLATYAIRSGLVEQDQVEAPGSVEPEPVPERVPEGEQSVAVAQESQDPPDGLVTPPDADESPGVVGMVELVISPPLQPIQVLKLHKWLGEVLEGQLSEVHPSWGGDTILEIDIRRSSPLVRLLSEMPLVAEVTEEESEDGVEGGPARFRLALNPI
jgi:DNA-binding NarL/FixJ family response regulator